jgi:hypothetical protein
MQILPPKEDDEAKAFTQYLNALYMSKKILNFSHIPNESSIRNPGYYNKMQAMGKRKGVPDYIIVTKTNIVFVELKRRKNAKGKSPSNVSDDQLIWIENLQSVGAKCAICYGCDDAINFLKKHI